MNGEYTNFSKDHNSTDQHPHTYLAHDLLQRVLAELETLHLQLVDDVPVSLSDAVVRLLVTAAKVLVLRAELQVPLRSERRLEVQTLRVS